MPQGRAGSPYISTAVVAVFSFALNNRYVDMVDVAWYTAYIIGKKGR